MNDVIALLKENNALLKEIKALLQDDLRAFSINVAANIFFELLQNNQDLLNKLKQHLKYE